MATWQVQQAKARFSALLDRAQHEGPQTITRHGTERAVLLSAEDYRALVAPRSDFRSYVLHGPKVDGFEVERDADLGRDVTV
jgi:antitoxin Phd